MNIIVTGGFEANFVVGFAKGLAANGVELSVVSCDATEARLKDAGIPNVNLRRSLDGKRASWIKLANLVRYYVRLIVLLIRHRDATVHFIGTFRDKLILWEGLFLNLCFRLFSGRYVYTVHNVLPHNHEHSRYFRLIYRRIYRLPHVLLVHTERTRRQLVEEFGVSKERICLTSIGLNEEMPMTNMTRAQARTQLGFDDYHQPILFFGNIDRYKGLDLLLEAFERLQCPSTRLVIAGRFRSGAYEAAILTQIAGMSRGKDVHFHDRFIPNEEAEIFFKGCDVLCLPYRQIYQSGLVFLGPRFGIPMVTTDVGELREFVGEALGIVTETNDAAGIAEALTKFLSTSEKFSQAEIFSRGVQYQWPIVCRGLLPLYAGHYSKASSPQAAGVRAIAPRDGTCSSESGTPSRPGFRT